MPHAREAAFDPAKIYHQGGEDKVEVRRTGINDWSSIGGHVFVPRVQSASSSVAETNVCATHLFDRHSVKTRNTADAAPRELPQELGNKLCPSRVNQPIDLSHVNQVVVNAK